MSSRVDGRSGVTAADPGQAQRPTASKTSSSPASAVTSHSARSSRRRAAVPRVSRCDVRAPDGRVDGTEMDGRDRAMAATNDTGRRAQAKGANGTRNSARDSRHKSACLPGCRTLRLLALATVLSIVLIRCDDQTKRRVVDAPAALIRPKMIVRDTGRRSHEASS